MKLLSVFFLILTVSTAFAIDRGQYAQVSPEIRKWFQEQKPPGSAIPCCSVADGTYAEEDIRGNQYWVRWRMPDTDTMTDWMPVPNNLIITTASPNGSPVVWYGRGPDGKLFIRCFVPGTKV